jgi:hypothetical protein
MDATLLHDLSAALVSMLKLPLLLNAETASRSRGSSGGRPPASIMFRTEAGLLGPTSSSRRPRLGCQKVFSEMSPHTAAVQINS